MVKDMAFLLKKYGAKVGATDDFQADVLGVLENLKHKQMKCDNCQFNRHYTTGRDEYPAYTTIPYCSKGHWENGPEPDYKTDKTDPWENCKDYELKAPKP